MVGDAAYKKALQEIREKNFENAFNTYVSAFLSRLNSRRIKEREFIAFYRYQFAEYLCNKMNFYIALPEGDMISDLILSEYNDFIDDISSSAFPFSRENMFRLLEEIKIIFPCHFKTDAETFFYLESK